MYHLIGFLFFLLSFLVFYTYLGYGIVAWLLVKLLRKNSPAQPVAVSDESLPHVTVVVPAYNERAYLPEKLQNCLDQDYPADKLHLLFVIEGSTDGSEEYLRQRQAELTGLQMLSGTQRLGKVSAMNRAMNQVTTPITIFTDANTQLSCRPN